MKNIKLINIRAIAIIIVVLGHSIILYSSKWNVYTTKYSILILDILKDFINIIQMPIFFSLSGYLLFTYLSKHQNDKFTAYIKKKTKRLGIPFVFISIFWMIPIRKIINFNNYKDISLFTIIKNLILGRDSGHLWYLPTLFLIFIIMFYLGKILIKRKKIKTDLVTLILLLILSINSFNLYIYQYLNSAFMYLFYFYIGWLINKYQNDLMKSRKKVLLFTIIMCSIFIAWKNTLTNYIIALSIIIILHLIIPNKTIKIMELIDKNSFGIYLFHSPLVYITYKLFANYNPIFVISINFLIFGTLSFLITDIIRKTKLKFIIGE